MNNNDSIRRNNEMHQWILLPSLAVLLFLATSLAAGQVLLSENFDDGNLEGWFNTESYSEKPWGPGNIQVADGELLYSTEGSIPLGTDCGILVSGFALSEWVESADPSYQDGFLRSKVRAEADNGATESGNIAMYVRGDLNTLTAYVAGAVGSNKAFVLDKFVNGAVAEEWVIEGVELTLNEDWFMELGAVGSDISMKIWKSGDPEPLTPQISVIDSDIASGTIGLTAAMAPCIATEPLQLRTFYDDVTFTVPEPISAYAILLALGVVGHVIRSKTRFPKQQSS